LVLELGSGYGFGLRIWLLHPDGDILMGWRYWTAMILLCDATAGEYLIFLLLLFGIAAEMYQLVVGAGDSDVCFSFRHEAGVVTEASGHPCTLQLLDLRIRRPSRTNPSSGFITRTRGGVLHRAAGKVYCSELVVIAVVESDKGGDWWEAESSFRSIQPSTFQVEVMKSQVSFKLLVFDY
jgi:hypothetical protein